MAQLKVPALNQKRIKFRIKGMAPLIMHAWSAKGREQLAMTAQERKKVPKVARNPEQSAHDATYWIESDGGLVVGFPLLAFKASLITACHKDLGLEKTMFRKSFFLPSTSGNLVQLEYTGEPVIREDIVRVGMSQTDIRYRPMFEDWGVQIEAITDADNLTEQDIVNLVTRAGFGVGVCEWRPEKGGEFGRYTFDSSFPMEVAAV